MRANKIMRYESILQVLGETGCEECWGTWPNSRFHNVDWMHRGEEYAGSRKGR
jgi:hypothetical protein